MGQGRQGLHGLHVLLVDDNLQNLEVAMRLLQAAGSTVTTTENGQLALDLLVAQPTGFDIVLMDVAMPVMDGLLATRKIRENPQWNRLPVVAFTGDALESACLEAGMQDFFSKPYLLNELVQVIWRNLEKMGHPLAMSKAR